MGYWDATDKYLRQHGSSPTCPYCGKRMVAADDHGRFFCVCRPNEIFDGVTGTTSRIPSIPQVNTAGMTDAQKAAIPPINRLHAEPTEAERKILDLLLKDPEEMDTPGYAEALEALQREREGK